MATDYLAPIIPAAVDKLVSIASASGYFDRVQAYEPKSNPGTGLTFATWIVEVRPIPLQSGLAVTSARMPMMGRIYLPMLDDPQDQIDTKVTVAAGHIMTELSAAFDVVNGAYLDLEGAYGDGLMSQLGYINDLDDAAFRIADITVPVICPDVFTQGSGS